MAFCTKCGAQIDDNAVICPSCGAQQETNANANANGSNFNAGFTPPPAPNGNIMGDDFTFQYDPNDVQQNKAMAVLAYFWVLFLVPLLAAPNSQFARFHANQGLVLFLADIAGGIVIGILTAILIWIPIVGVILTGLISGVFSIGMLVLMIMGIVNAASGKAKEVPILGKIKIIK